MVEIVVGMEILIEAVPVLLCEVRQTADVHVIFQISQFHEPSGLVGIGSCNKVGITLTFLPRDREDGVDSILSVA